MRVRNSLHLPIVTTNKAKEKRIVSQGSSIVTSQRRLACVLQDVFHLDGLLPLKQPPHCWGVAIQGRPEAEVLEVLLRFELRKRVLPYPHGYVHVAEVVLTVDQLEAGELGVAPVERVADADDRLGGTACGRGRGGRHHTALCRRFLRPPRARQFLSVDVHRPGGGGDFASRLFKQVPKRAGQRDCRTVAG